MKHEDGKRDKKKKTKKRKERGGEGKKAKPFHSRRVDLFTSTRRLRRRLRRHEVRSRLVPSRTARYPMPIVLPLLYYV